jgi:hypothetical protein
MDERNTESDTVSVGPCVFVLRAPPVISDVSLNTTVNISRGYVPRESLVEHGLRRGRVCVSCGSVKTLKERLNRFDEMRLAPSKNFKSHHMRQMSQ